MNSLFLFSSAVERDPDVEAWFSAADYEVRRMMHPWFERLRTCGPDVRELLHDGHPVTCAGEAAFAYVDAFSAHGNIGFYFGAALADPTGALQGAGKSMRHVKVRWGEAVQVQALDDLIAAAYRDIQTRLSAET